MIDTLLRDLRQPELHPRIDHFDIQKGVFSPIFKVNERVKGIEPSCAAWEAAVLPLNYTRGWKK
jgi:hypothetical protein